MMNKNSIRIFLSYIILLGFCSCGHVDKSSKIVINEVLTENVQNYQDDYGMHHAWVEIFNRSYGSVDVAGYQLRVCNAQGDTMIYSVPKGDVQTVIKPRQHALFWMDGEPSKGTFHTNCTLQPEQVNEVILCDNGHQPIDAVKVPVLEADHSYARVEDASSKWEVKGGDPNHYVTPSTNNLTIDRNSKVDKFKEKDERGFGMALTAMSVVFSGLLALFISFKCLGTVALSVGRRMKEKLLEKFHERHHQMKAEDQKVEAMNESSDEVYAAIAMALHESMGAVHDVEQQVLTIRRVQSPWSAKYNTLRVIPQMK
jgi:Na+-transporting methylmalonyl-CoA/oxaloacetate decarboxylase gamma subunit